MGLFDRLRGDGDPRVAFVGIDGVPYSLIEDNPDVFPNLTTLAGEGAGGAIDSIVMNVVATFPPQRNLQRMVSGFLSPGVEKAAVPGEFRRYLESIGYRIDVDPGLGKEDTDAFLEDAHETIDARREAFEHCIRQDDWDLFFGVFMATDRVNHFLFEDYERDGAYYEAFVEFYRTLDEYIGELRGTLAEDVTLVVASDHGFTTLDEKLRGLEGPEGRPVVDRVVPREEAFHGDHDDIAPDLVAIPNHGFDLKAGFTPKERLFDKGKRNGMHTFGNASLLIDDPGVSIDGTVDLFDLAPTILDVMDVEYDPGRMDGRTLR